MVVFFMCSTNRRKMFNNISPRIYAWLGTSSGLRGVNYNCAVNKGTAQAEVYIDRGKEGSNENKDIFEALNSKKNQIEKDFGESLEWESLPDSRACRIKKVTEIGGWQEEEKWEEVHSKVIDYSIRIKKAFDPIIKEVQKKY